jgi:hypothetical protein
MIDQALALGVNIRDLKGDVTEIATAGVYLLVPVMGQLHQWSVFIRSLGISGRREEYERKLPGSVLRTPHLLKAEGAEASRVFRRLLSVRRSYHEQDEPEIFA